ncbi:MAG: signal peptide peptidase SppA [Candidatus Altiarchaeota archaeon]
MKTFWKVLVTFGVLAFFVVVIASIVIMLTQIGSMPVIGRGSVAVIPLRGMITMSGCPGGLFYVEECSQVSVIKQYLNDASKDSSIKAVVLYVDSGGGNVVASRELMRAVKEFDKPVVTWIGEVGASGAYYVASASDYVVADEDSMTGSIGVIMFVQHYYELMDEIGVNVTVIKSGKSKDLGSPFRPMDEDEKERMQAMIDEVYSDFVADVAENRNLSVDEVRGFADGSIYLGSEAKKLGLVDENGGFDDAVDIAGRLGGIEGKPDVKNIKKTIGWKDVLMGGESPDLVDSLMYRRIFKYELR